MGENNEKKLWLISFEEKKKPFHDPSIYAEEIF